MAKNNQYKWLIIVEGESDEETYKTLLVRSGEKESDFRILSAECKSRVLNAEGWGKIKLENTCLFDEVVHFIGSKNSLGIILVVDTDTNETEPFKRYERNKDINYINNTKKQCDGYYVLDTMNGAKEVPVYGVTVPYKSQGCLETDLLSAYGFPVDGQTAYCCLTSIIKQTSDEWGIPKNSEGKEWWENNEKAKMDKFVYSSLSHGFWLCSRKQKVPLPNKIPDVIKNIKTILSM